MVLDDEFHIALILLQQCAKVFRQRHNENGVDISVHERVLDVFRIVAAIDGFQVAEING